MERYHFYKSNLDIIVPLNDDFNFIKDQYHLYDLLSDIWCKYSCAPRLRIRWNESNKTLGQCSITSFLFQDIFGGEVYGIKLDDGNYHCYNIINGLKIDLTSEQFGDEKLDYDSGVKQDRNYHFSKKEKYERYLYLKDKLLEKGKNK